MYGLIAMKHMAECECAKAISSAELAEAYGLPRETVAKVLQHLADGGLLVAHHGVRGGYTLALDPRQISVLDVILASGSLIHRSGNPRPDALHLTMLDHTIEAVLNDMKIADIAEFKAEHKKEADRDRNS